MLEIRHAQDRGHAGFSWLDSHHSFSFGHYYDPEQIGFSDLLVINDDRVEGESTEIVNEDEEAMHLHKRNKGSQMNYRS